MLNDNLSRKRRPGCLYINMTDHFSRNTLNKYENNKSDAKIWTTQISIKNDPLFLKSIPAQNFAINLSHVLHRFWLNKDKT